jgi:hypothetical protein
MFFDFDVECDHVINRNRVKQYNAINLDIQYLGFEINLNSYSSYSSYSYE